MVLFKTTLHSIPEDDMNGVELICRNIIILLSDSLFQTTLEWVPWMKHYMWTGGNKAVEYCDYMGEGLANFLGITTPKYQLEINEHERLVAEREKMAAENAGWMTSNGTNGAIPLVVSQPMAIGDDPAPV